MIQEGDITFLNKAVKDLEEAFSKLEEAHKKKDSVKFNEAKKKVLITEKGIVEATR